MTDAQKILELIENVDPRRMDTLNEIDARVWCLTHKNVFLKICTEREKHWHCTYFLTSGFSLPIALSANRRYARSRNALKAIRPKGWGFDINQHKSWETDESSFRAYLHRSSCCKCSLNLPTEELAELYAIIQAIEWDRINER